MHTTVDHIVKSMGSEAVLTISDSYPVTCNDPELTSMVAPTLKRVGGLAAEKEVPSRVGIGSLADWLVGVSVYWQIWEFWILGIGNLWYLRGICQGLIKPMI